MATWLFASHASLQLQHDYLHLQEACWVAFIERVRNNLHCVLAMSPVGGAFRSRCRMFPSLTNCCTIDWFRPWPDQALLSVSTQVLQPLDLAGQPHIKPALASMCVHIHSTVAAASEKMYAQLRRRSGLYNILSLVIVPCVSTHRAAWYAAQNGLLRLMHCLSSTAPGSFMLPG